MSTRTPRDTSKEQYAVTLDDAIRRGKRLVSDEPRHPGIYTP